MPRFAVDSASAVDAGVWARVIEAAGAAPAAWFRYIGGPYAVTGEEVAWLHARGCAVGLIYNGATPEGVADGRERGEADAAAAIAAARALGAPHTTLLFVDVEAAWSPTADWLEGWADGQRAGPYRGAGGIYANPLAPAFRRAFTAARDRSANVAALALWSAQPEPGPGSAAAAPAWRPATVAGQPVAVWQYAENAYGGLVDLDLVDDAFDGLWAPARADGAAHAVTPAPEFADVPPGAWYARDVSDAVAAGLMRGVAPGRFAPRATVNRAALAAVAARIARRAGWR